MENRGDVKSGCKGVLLRNSGRICGVLALGADSGRTGSVRTLELNSGRTGRTGRSEGASDACVFFADEYPMWCHRPSEQKQFARYMRDMRVTAS